MGDMPMGMADGGLAMLPIPETMFDEPMNGGYADGGIVAFAEAGPVGYMQEAPEDEELEAVGSRGRYGYAPTFEGNMALTKKYAPQQSKYGDKLTSFYEAEMSPEAQKKRGKQDLNSFLMSFGAKLASTRGPLLSAAGEAAGQTLPGYQESVKQRRAEQRDAIKTLAAREDMTNKQATETFRLANDMQKAYGGFMDTEAQRELTEKMNKADNKVRMTVAQIVAASSRYDTDKRSQTQKDYFAEITANIIKQVAAAATAQLPELRNNIASEVGAANNALKMAVSGGDKKAIADARAALAAAETKFVNGQVALAMNAGMSGGLPGVPGAPGAPKGGMPALPPGFVSDQ
jgi:hypothetical protein